MDVLYVNSMALALALTMSLNTIKQPSESEFSLFGSNYENPLSTICKNAYMSQNVAFSVNEIRDISHWLHTREFHEFQPVDKQFDDICYRGTFTTISPIRFGNDIVGLELTFETNAPYGFSPLKTLTFQIEENGACSFYNDNDDDKYLYPSQLGIQLLMDDNLIVTNSLEPTRKMVIKNYTKDEIITIDCKNKIIQTVDEEHKIYDDFNFKFLRFTRSKYNIENILHFTLSNEFTITYSAIRKVGLLCQ